MDEMTARLESGMVCSSRSLAHAQPLDDKWCRIVKSKTNEQACVNLGVMLSSQIYDKQTRSLTQVLFNIKIVTALCNKGQHVHTS